MAGQTPREVRLIGHPWCFPHQIPTMMDNWPDVLNEERACYPLRKAIKCGGGNVIFHNNKLNCEHLTYKWIHYYCVINSGSYVDRGAADSGPFTPKAQIWALYHILYWIVISSTIQFLWCYELNWFSRLNNRIKPWAQLSFSLLKWYILFKQNVIFKGVTVIYIAIDMDFLKSQNVSGSGK